MNETDHSNGITRNVPFDWLRYSVLDRAEVAALERGSSVVRIACGAILAWVFQADNDEDRALLMHLSEDEVQLGNGTSSCTEIIEAARGTLYDRHGLIVVTRENGVGISQYEIPVYLNANSFTNDLHQQAERIQRQIARHRFENEFTVVRPTVPGKALAYLRQAIGLYRAPVSD